MRTLVFMAVACSAAVFVVATMEPRPVCANDGAERFAAQQFGSFLNPFRGWLRGCAPTSDADRYTISVDVSPDGVGRVKYEPAATGRGADQVLNACARAYLDKHPTFSAPALWRGAHRDIELASR